MKANIAPVLKKEKTGNYRVVSLTSILGKVMKQSILETISRHTNNTKIITSCQHGFTMGKSWSNNPTTFYSEMTGLADEGRAVNSVCPDFSKAFNTVFCKIFAEKLLMCRLDEQPVRWTENWLNS